MRPKSTRLNSENREKFIQRVLEDKLPDKNYPDDDRFYDKWRDKIYEHVYGPYIHIMDQLPSWFFVKSKTMHVNLYVSPESKQKVQFGLKNEIIRINEDNGYYGIRSELPTLDYDDEVCRDFRTLIQAQKDFRVQKDTLRNQLRKLAYSCNTSGQLYDAWEEAINYAECFPYKAPERHQGADVSQREMDIGITIATTSIKLPDDY